MVRKAQKGSPYSAGQGLTILPAVIGALLATRGTHTGLREVSGPGFCLCCKLVVRCKVSFFCQCNLSQLKRFRYTEAIEVLYTNNTFKSTQHHNTIYFPKYLLKQRLHSIRSFHCTLQLGYPWGALRQPLLALVELRGLQKLHVEGATAGMIDSQNLHMIDAIFWRQRRHYIIPFIHKLDFIKDVDLYLPILASDLGKDIRVGHCRVHGIVAPLMTKQLESAGSSVA